MKSILGRKILSRFKPALLACASFALLLTVYSCEGSAGEEKGLLGISLPADFRAFSDDSPWNTPIGPDPKVDPLSPLMIGNLSRKSGAMHLNFKRWSIPLFVIDSSVTPGVDVTTTASHLNPLVDPDDDGIARGLPIPDGVWGDPEGDGHMLLVDPVARKTWDFSRARRGPDGTWTASRIDEWDLDGVGYREPFTGKYWWTYGATAAGFPLVAGIVRPEEIEAGRIEHALIFASPVTRKNSIEGGGKELCAPPASRTDGTETGLDAIPEGARLQLDPELDLDSLGLSPAMKVIARAMQEYGLFHGMVSKRFKIVLQNLGPGGGKWNKYGDLKGEIAKIPVKSFRVLKCNMVTK